MKANGNLEINPDRAHIAEVIARPEKDLEAADVNSKIGVALLKTERGLVEADAVAQIENLLDVWRDGTVDVGASNAVHCLRVGQNGVQTICGDEYRTMKMEREDGQLALSQKREHCGGSRLG